MAVDHLEISQTMLCRDDSTDQRETKGQKAREKYASMLAYKSEVNAKKRESYQYKKAEREATRNNTENLGIIFFYNPTHQFVNLLTQNALTICRCCVCD